MYRETVSNTQEHIFKHLDLQYVLETEICIGKEVCIPTHFESPKYPNTGVSNLRHMY